MNKLHVFLVIDEFLGEMENGRHFWEMSKNGHSKISSKICPPPPPFLKFWIR